MPPKRCRTVYTPVQVVSERTLSRLAAHFAQVETSHRACREHIARTRRTLLDSCSATLRLPLAGGGDFAWPVSNLPKLVQQYSVQCPGFLRVLAESLKRHPAGPRHPWHLVLYLDEVVPGNVLSPDNARKVMAFYLAFREFDEALFMEDMWLPLAVIRRVVVEKVVGGWSAVVAALLSSILMGPAGLVSGGIGVAVPEVHTIFGRLGNVLADEAALHCAWDSKGSSGLFPCFLCRNVASSASQLAAHDASGTLVGISCPSYARLQLNTDHHIWVMADTLSAMAPTSTKQALRTRERVFGLNLNVHGLLYNMQLRPYVLPASTYTFDPMHVFFVSGIVNFELYLFLNHIKAQLGIGYTSLHEACQADWVWPSWTQAGCVKKIFSERRARHNVESVRASAAELVACYPIVRHWVSTVVEPGGVAAAQVRSVLALFDVLDLMDVLKFNFSYAAARELQPAVERHLAMFVEAYGEESVKPKHHMALHIAPQLLRDGAYLDCFPVERKNKVTKACASHNSNPGNKYEASVLGRLLVEQASHLQQVRHQGLDCPMADPVLAAALQVATCFVSRVMTEGWRRLSQGMLVFSSGQAFLVQACLQVDGVLAALCQRLVPQPSLSGTTSTWLRASSELVAVPFSDCTRVAKCWKKLSDGSLLALGRWRVA